MSLESDRQTETDKSHRLGQKNLRLVYDDEEKRGPHCSSHFLRSFNPEQNFAVLHAMNGA